MQAAACLFAFGVYAAAAVHAWRVLPQSEDFKSLFTLLFPGVYLQVVLWAVLIVTPVRRWLKRYTWLTFAAGFGRSPTSILTALGVLALAGAFIYLQIGEAQRGGRYPGGLFSAYAAGIGVLCAQALLALRLEQEPKIREIIAR